MTSRSLLNCCLLACVLFMLTACGSDQQEPEGSKAVKAGQEVPSVSSYSGIVLDTIKSSRDYVFSVASMDFEVEPGSSQTLGDTLPDTKRTPEDEAIYNCRREMVEELVQTLPESERVIIRNRYSLASHERKTLRQIGSMLGLSAETVRQKEKRAIKRMHAVANLNTERYSI